MRYVAIPKITFQTVVTQGLQSYIELVEQEPVTEYKPCPVYPNIGIPDRRFEVKVNRLPIKQYNWRFRNVLEKSRLCKILRDNGVQYREFEYYDAGDYVEVVWEMAIQDEVLPFLSIIDDAKKDEIYQSAFKIGKEHGHKETGKRWQELWKGEVNRFNSLPWYRRVWIALKGTLFKEDE